MIRPCAIVVALWAVACAGPPASSAPREAPLRDGPLTDFVPAAGLRWIAVGRLADLAHTEGVRPLLAELIPPSRLEAFALSTGVDLTETATAVAAGFDYSTVYLAETPFENTGIEKRFVERLVTGATVESKHPRVRRVWGTIGSTAESLVRVDRRFVAFVVGDPSQAKVVELFVTGRLSRSPTALEGSALRGVPEEFGAAPLRFYAPGPFTGEWERGARGLLAGATGFAAVATPEGADAHVKAVLLGAFTGIDVARWSSAWSDLAESGMGRLTGLDQPSQAAHASLENGRLVLDVKVPLKPLFAGLRAAVAADVWELLGPPGRPDPARPVGPRDGP